MNKKLISRKFAQSLKSYDNNAIAQKKICQNLIRLLTQTNRRQFDRVVEIGCGTGLLSKYLIKELNIQNILFNDLVQETHSYIKKLMADYETINWQFYPGDAEEISLPADIDLLISASTFQWFDDINGFFQKVQHVLKPDGLFAFSSFGVDNFIEIKKILGHSLAYKKSDHLKSALQSGFEIIDFQEELLPVSFKEPMDVLRHIKCTGVNGIHTEVWGKSKLTGFVRQYKDYAAQNGENGGVTLTYHPIYFIVRKKRYNGY